MALQTKSVSTGDYGWQSWSNGYVISLTLTEESTDIATNTSLVSYLFTISNTNHNRFVDNNNSWTISIGGQDIAIRGFHFDLSANYTTQTIASGQVTVAHNADGSRSMPYHVSVPNIQGWNQYGPPAMSLSGEWSLTDIPRASGVACPTGTIGKSLKISIDRGGAGLTHTLTYSFGALQGTIAAAVTGDNVLWTVPTAFYSQIPSAKSGIGTISCKTYSGNTVIGESQCRFTINVDESACQPTISAQVADSNPATLALTGNANTLIRYHSNGYVTGAYSAKNSATVADYRLVHNGKEHRELPVTIPNAENGVFDFRVTDSRGYTANLTVQKTVIPYVKLTCSLSGNKPDTDGNMKLCIRGNYFNGDFGAASNELTVQYRYKVSGTPWTDAQKWKTVTPIISKHTYVAEDDLTGLDYQAAYIIQAKAVDKLETVESVEYTARIMPVFDWGEQDFQFHVPVYGITPEMVGIRHVTNDGTLLLDKLGVEAGLLFVRDSGNLDSYYLGLFSGYRYGRVPHFHILGANAIGVITNTTGTVTATGLAGEATYGVIPFITS